MKTQQEKTEIIVMSVCLSWRRVYGITLSQIF